MALGTPSFGSIGSRVGNGSATIASAGGGATTDLVLACIAQKPATANGGGITPPAGWTLVASKLGAGGYGMTTGDDVGNVNVYVYRQDTPTVGGDSFVVTTSDSSVTLGLVGRWPSSIGLFSIATTTAEDTSGDASATYAGSANPGTAADDLLVAVVGMAGAIVTLSAQNFTQTGATFGARTSAGLSSTGNNNVYLGVWSANLATGPGSAAPSATATASGTLTNARGGAVIVRVREVITGQANINLGSITTTLRGKLKAKAAATISLGAFTAGIAANAPVKGATGTSLGAFTLTGRAKLIYDGELVKTLGNFTLSSTAEATPRAPPERRALVEDGSRVANTGTAGDMSLRTAAPKGESRSASAME